jgi:hypothetical protein
MRPLGKNSHHAKNSALAIAPVKLNSQKPQ